MYLPTFYKLGNEVIAKRLIRYGSWGAPAALWGIFTYNLRV